MEALAGLGVAANIFQFIEYGLRIVAEAKRLKDNQGLPDPALEQHVIELKGIVLGLQKDRSETPLTLDHQSLLDLSYKCLGQAGELQGLLGSLKAQRPGSVCNRVRAVVKGRTRAKDKARLELDLQRSKELLHIQLTKLAREETLSKLEEALENHRRLDDSLQGLMCNIEALRSAIVKSGGMQVFGNGVADLLDQSHDMVMAAMQNIILNAISVPETHHRYDEIRDAHMCTFGWLLPNEEDEEGSEEDEEGNADPRRIQARDALNKWLRDEDGIFHICGKPGAGKSVLMKYLSTHPQLLRLSMGWAADSSLSVGSFYLWGHGTPSQKRLPGLIRGLLYSLLRSNQKLVSVAFPELSKSLATFVHLQGPMDDRSIRQAFNNILDGLARETSHRAMLLIDGLDELDGDLRELVLTLFQWTEHCQGSLKILVSSREWNIFEKSFRDCPRIRLHEVTMKDMQGFISARLDSNDEFLELDSHSRMAIKSTISTKAEGVFLWVSLVLQMMEEALLAGDGPSELSAKLAECPTELKYLFSHILMSIPETDRKWAFRAIQLATFENNFDYSLKKSNFSLMSLLMWPFLGDYNNDPSFALKLSPKECQPGDIQRHISLAKRMINGRCKGLLNVVKEPVGVPPRPVVIHRDYRVRVIHSSIRAFLQQEEAHKVMQPYIDGFDVPDCLAQTFLAMLKIRCPDDYEKWQPRIYIMGLGNMARPWVEQLPNGVDEFLIKLVPLLFPFPGSNYSHRSFQFLDALGPAMAKIKVEGATLPDHCQWRWSDLGLFLSYYAYCHEYLAWKVTTIQSTPPPTTRLFYSHVANLMRFLIRRGTTEAEDRALEIINQLSALGYDWNREDTPMTIWKVAALEMLKHAYPRLLDSMLRKGFNGDCLLIQGIKEAKDLPEDFGKNRPFDAIYHNYPPDHPGPKIYYRFIAPISSPLSYLAWKCNWVVSVWDFVQFQLPELFEYYVQLAACPHLEPPEALATVQPPDMIGFSDYGNHIFRC